MKQKLITKEIQQKLDKNTGNPEKDNPYLKLFNPTGGGTWLITTIKDDIMYGLCDLGVGYPELGTISFKELTGIKFPPFGLPVERDKFFTPKKTLAEYATEAWKTKRIVA